MTDKTDEQFFSRADEHISLSNQQVKTATKGEASASMLFATARFNAWVSACGCDSGNELSDVRDEAIEYFTSEYRRMLEENLDEYIANFDRYMAAPGDDA